jgi:N-acetylneuraminic acid mutarotase
MKDARYRHTATVLTNGKVLVTGGVFNYTTCLKSAELYDPSTGTWTAMDNMNSARYEHAASVLNNGKVLVTSGVNNNVLNSTELY